MTVILIQSFPNTELNSFTSDEVTEDIREKSDADKFAPLKSGQDIGQANEKRNIDLRFIRWRRCDVKVKDVCAPDKLKYKLAECCQF